jgi:hypothetical protein
MIVFGGSWICRLGCFKGRLSPAPFKMIGLFLGCVDRSPLTIDCLTAAWAAGIGNHIEWLPLYKGVMKIGLVFIINPITS